MKTVHADSLYISRLTIHFSAISITVIWRTHLSIGYWGGKRPSCTAWGGWVTQRRGVARYTSGGELGAGGGWPWGAETQHTLALQWRQLGWSWGLFFFWLLGRRGLNTCKTTSNILMWVTNVTNIAQNTNSSEYKSLTCISQTQQSMLLRGYSNSGGSHGVFEIFPEVKKSIEAK